MINMFILARKIDDKYIPETSGCYEMNIISVYKEYLEKEYGFNDLKLMEIVPNDIESVIVEKNNNTYEEILPRFNGDMSKEARYKLNSLQIQYPKRSFECHSRVTILYEGKPLCRVTVQVPSSYEQLNNTLS